MTKIHHGLTLLIICLSSLSAIAQEGTYVEIRDLETWTSAKVNFRMNEKWKFSMMQQLRLDQNSSERKSMLTQVALRRDFNDLFNMEGGLRYTNRKDNEGEIQGNEHYFRFQVDLNFKHEIQRFDMKYRLRYTNSNEMGISYEEGDVNERYLRLKVETKYNFKNWKLDPEVSTEIFNNQDKFGQQNGFDQVRLTAGTSYKMGGLGKLGVYYRMERELGLSYPKTTNIIQIKYAYTFKK